MSTHTVQTLLGAGRWGAVLLPEAEQGCLTLISFAAPPSDPPWGRSSKQHLKGYFWRVFPLQPLPAYYNMTFTSFPHPGTSCAYLFLESPNTLAEWITAFGKQVPTSFLQTRVQFCSLLREVSYSGPGPSLYPQPSQHWQQRIFLSMFTLPLSRTCHGSLLPKRVVLTKYPEGLTGSIPAPAPHSWTLGPY